MSLHKLTAGSGYDYLTRQVAALDVTEKGHVGLAAYYAERGESPGVWVGSGMDGIDGVDAGDPVTAEQMRNLFGHGMHPLADVRAQHFEVSDIMLDAVDDAMWLGAPFRVVDEATPFRVEVAKRIADLNALIGAPADAEVAASSRARIGLSWRRSSSTQSTAATRSTPESSQPRSRRTLDHARSRSPVMT